MALSRSSGTMNSKAFFPSRSLGLAPAIVHHIYEFINKLRATGLTILLVEQNAKMALQNAERAYVMALGRIAKKGRAEEIAASSDLAALYLGG